MSGIQEICNNEAGKFRQRTGAGGAGNGDVASSTEDKGPHNVG